jgi:hypothetical protein
LDRLGETHEAFDMKNNKSEFLLFVLFLIFLVGCVQKETSNIKAVYIVGEEQQLSDEELLQHPEIAVVKNFDKLKETIKSTKASIWIDKSALHLVDVDWLHQKPQKYYPLVLVGYNNALYSFREKLAGFNIEGPYVDWSEEKLEPGFSVWILIKETKNSSSSILRGYDLFPTVENIIAAIEPYLH